MTEPACYRIPLQHYPGMNRFVLDWMNGDERFLARGSTKRMKHPAAPEPLVRALIESNRKWGLDVADEVRRWAAGDTFTIIAGQQAGFAGGPLYTIVKLASMLKMKRDNEARGIPTTVFFWIATEDHDFDEVATIALPSSGQKDLVQIRAHRFNESKTAVGPQQIPEQLIEEFLKVAGIERPKWLRSGITFADSFAELLAMAVEEKFILVDAMLPALQGAPIVQEILKRWDDVQRSIATRSEELLKAGYTPQVTPRPGDGGYTLLFRFDEHGNRELVHRAEEASGHLSMSALTRPLLQDSVFHPDVCIGGPSEVAYFAQIQRVHELLGVPMPRVALRGHVLPASGAVIRKFAKYGIKPENVFTTPEDLLSQRESGVVNEVKALAGVAETKLRENIDRIRELTLPADHAISRSINRSIGHIEYHFRKLTERSIRALVRKDRERFDAARALIATFFPDHHVQDRVVAWVPFWLHGNGEFIERLISEVEPDTPFFKIVSV